MNPGTVVVIALSAFLVLWYGAGYLYNRRRGEWLFHWLQAGLETLGGESEAGWLGSPTTGARVNVLHAAPPFRRLEITLLLETREVMPLWLVNHLYGRRDRLIIKSTLRSPRQGEIELLPPHSQTARALRQEQEQPWTWGAGPRGLALAYRGTGAEQQVARLMAWWETYGDCLDRLSWRKADPHLQLQMRVGKLSARPSRRFFADLQTAVHGVDVADH